MTKSLRHPPGLAQSGQATPFQGEVKREIMAVVFDWKFWLKVLGILGAGLWIYAPVFHGDWLMDDDLYITNNHLLADPARLEKAWFQPGSFIEYYPIEQTVQWIQWQLWKNDTLGYHLTNLGLHLLSALLIWRLLTKFNLRRAWLGGLIFAIHPALVESVAWIVELKNTLSLPPFLLAMCFYIDYERYHRKRDYLLALMSFLVAMLCKVSMASFPAVILLYVWWERGRIEWKDIKASLPFLFMSFVLVGLTLRSGMLFSETNRMMGLVPIDGFLSRVALIGESFSFYLATSLWPFGLLPLYPRWPVDSPSLLQLLPWPVGALAVLWFWRKRRTWGRHALLGFGFFFLTVAPFTGFILISYMRFTWVMDHFVYLPIIGLIGLVVAGLDLLEKRFSSPLPFQVRAVLGLVLIGLAWNSHRYAEKFVDQETLWNYTIQRNPNAWPAYSNLGSILLEKDQLPQARQLFEQALQLNPDYIEAHYNLGLTLLRLGQVPEAIDQMKQAAKLAPNNTEILFMLGRTLQRNGRIAEAIEQYQSSLPLLSDNPEIHARLGALFIQSGHFPEAVEEFRRTVQLVPTVASSHNDLGNAFYLTGQTAQAMTEYRQALQLNPSLVEAHNNLGGALQRAGQVKGAIEEYQVALWLAPNNPKLHANLGSALQQAGQIQEAIHHYKMALLLDPAYVEAKDRLAALQNLPPSEPTEK